MALGPEIYDPLLFNNLKYVQDRVLLGHDEHINRVRVIAEGGLQMFTKNLHELDASQAAALATLGGVDIGKITAIVGELQQAMKGAQTTLPETGR